MKVLYDTNSGEMQLQKGFDIVVDNSGARSHNINIDRPRFFCFAFSEAEAIGKMMQSDFQYKHKTIDQIIAF